MFTNQKIFVDSLNSVYGFGSWSLHDSKIILAAGVVEDEKALSDQYEILLENEKSIEYMSLRKKEYDKLNQYEMQFDDLQNNTTTWQDAILAIKAKYPKPSDD